MLSEELVNDRMKYIAEFIDNLQEVLLEGLSADMDSISTYILSKHCELQNTSTSTSSEVITINPTTTTSIPMGSGKETKGINSKQKDSRFFYVRQKDDNAIDRSTNRGRSYSVNDGHMSNVVLPGVDLEAMYRKVIRRQVELEIYFPSRDAVETMMDRQFGQVDRELER